MKKVYEMPCMLEVKLKSASALLAGSEPETVGSGNDGKDGAGLSRSYASCWDEDEEEDD